VSRPVVICRGRTEALTIERCRRSWKAGFSKLTRSAAVAASITLRMAVHDTSSVRSRCISVRSTVTMPLTASTATRARTDGRAAESAPDDLVASSCVRSLLAIRICAPSATPPITWSSTVSMNGRRAASHTSWIAWRRSPGSCRMARSVPGPSIVSASKATGVGESSSGTGVTVGDRSSPVVGGRHGR
jgi:hypothetical protein